MTILNECIIKIDKYNIQEKEEKNSCKSWKKYGHSTEGEAILS